MNLNKSLEYFDPSKVTEPITIVGCGAVGSTLAEHLARYGLTKFRLYDFDKVEEKNLVNQMFFRSDLGKYKVEAVGERIKEINDEAEVKCYNSGWTDQLLSGYVFLCVDSIDTRRKIVAKNKFNSRVKGFFDFRVGLVNAEHFACCTKSFEEIRRFEESMNFTDDEVKVKTSACGITLGVASTVRLIVDLGACNFIRFIRSDGKELKKFIAINIETLDII